ncbi:GNAT family N-acetyltransferase [Vibrio diazotrophicus]|uniref:GNAT family N-acetyltransferase n=1 Tax=Vibrio diazotrophicus TaxID=685 RepID=UPI00142D3C49|nr:GNAT family N-acetyltransferase [Vibrio diazotrophicus]NIY93783.1 GNAT family N-acetyltransferase [Vibrio diazotrophicus]
MYLRKAKVSELDIVYSMGFDVWNDGQPFEEYLTDCQNSKKYQSGNWYVLVAGEQLVSSLIVYSGLFGLKEGSFGIGSFATIFEHRNKGYGSTLINLVKRELFKNPSCNSIYLHSDIERQYYENLGFVSVNDSDCMCAVKNGSIIESSIPDYF